MVIYCKEDVEKAIISIGQELIKRAKDISNDVVMVNSIEINAEILPDEVVNMNVTKNYTTNFEDDKKDRG